MLPCIPYEKAFLKLSTMTNIFLCAEGEHTLFLFLKWKKIGLQPDFGEAMFTVPRRTFMLFKSAHRSLIVLYDLPDLAEKKAIVWNH